MATTDLSAIVGPGWPLALEPVAPQITAMGNMLRQELAAGRSFLPEADAIFRAYQTPFDQVKVVILGQDPYPTPGHAMGLAFSVAPEITPVPRSLANIFTEYEADLGYPRPTSGDLSPWAGQGVMLLNRSLTVTPGEPGSHRGRGWESITEATITALALRNAPLVGVLWGRDARNTAPLFLDHPTVESTHPSPLSASRGFFGSAPFSAVNRHLTALGTQPVEWRLP